MKSIEDRLGQLGELTDRIEVLQPLAQRLHEIKAIGARLLAIPDSVAKDVLGGSAL